MSTNVSSKAKEVATRSIHKHTKQRMHAIARTTQRSRVQKPRTKQYFRKKILEQMVLSPSLSQCLLFKFSFSCHEKRYIKWNTRREIIHLEASCLRLDYFLCGVCVSWFLFNTASNCCCHAMLLFLSLQNFQVLFLLLLFASNGFFSSVFCFVVWCVYLFHLLPFFPFWERRRQTNHFRNLKKERNSIKEPDSLHCYIDRWTYSTKELNRKTHLIFSFF